MFGFWKSNDESWRNKFASTEAMVKRGHIAWDNADVELRTLLLKNVMDIEDDRLFLAYVHAAWGQIPESVQLKIAGAVMVYQETPDVLRGR
jgi:hypothetical protein